MDGWEAAGRDRRPEAGGRRPGFFIAKLLFHEHPQFIHFMRNLFPFYSRFRIIPFVLRALSSQPLSGDLQNTVRIDLRKQILDVCIVPKDRVPQTARSITSLCFSRIVPLFKYLWLRCRCRDSCMFSWPLQIAGFVWIHMHAANLEATQSSFFPSSNFCPSLPQRRKTRH